MSNKQEFICSIDADLLERFKGVVVLNKQEVSEVVERLMNNYIADSLEGLLQTHKKSLITAGKTVDINFRKAVNKIELWKNRPWQNNHKILKAFWELESELGVVTVDSLEARCGDKENYPKTYVEKFDANFVQMRTDKGNSNGKVFDIYDENKVKIWNEVYEGIAAFKEDFLNS
jgi:hypothetical protein